MLPEELLSEKYIIGMFVFPHLNVSSAWLCYSCCTERSNPRKKDQWNAFFKELISGSMYCMWSSIQWSGGRAALWAPLHFPIENPWLPAEGEPHTCPHAQRAREVTITGQRLCCSSSSSLCTFHLPSWNPAASQKLEVLIFHWNHNGKSWIW